MACYAQDGGEYSLAEWTVIKTQLSQLPGAPPVDPQYYGPDDWTW
jgi:hypothetical protein